jgi:archaellum component FlaC
MPAIFRTDSGIFGDIQASNMIVTGEIKVGTEDQTINQYITQQINTVVGDGVDYSEEINTLSGNIDTVSGDLSTLSGVVDGLNVGGGTDLTDISGSLNIVSGRVDTISGDLVTTNNTLNIATGNIDTISGAVEGILNAEAADDTAFNNLSGSVDTISGDLVATNNTLNIATGNIDTISGEVENILVARVAEDEQFNLLSQTVDAATGNIDTISGAVEEILNAEVADDTAFNNLSGSVDTISGNLNTLSSTVDTATGDINEISGVVQNLSANSTTYGDADVATYLDGNLDAHIIPATNSTYDIGSAEKKIRHLYLSNNSLYIGGIEGEKGTQISATPEGAVVFPSGINITGNIDATGANINFGTIGDTPPSVENNVLQWSDVEQKWTAGDGLTNVSNTLDTTTGDLYSFYKRDNDTISNVSGSFDALNFQPTTIPTTKTSAGTKGQITYDENYVYMCVADNVWKRLPSADF